VKPSEITVRTFDELYTYTALLLNNNKKSKNKKGITDCWIDSIEQVGLIGNSCHCVHSLQAIGHRPHPTHRRHQLLRLRPTRRRLQAEMSLACARHMLHGTGARRCAVVLASTRC